MDIWYMNGAGNDFMVMDARGRQFDFSELAKKLCAITGADGFMAVDSCETADFRLHYYNADGSRGELCGNGSRCICRFALETGIAGPQMCFQTDAGIVTGRQLSPTQFAVHLGIPADIRLQALPGVDYALMGVPHALVPTPSLRWEDRPALLDKARALRFHHAFPKGANVDFYDWLGENTVRILTFERGVEDYTLACGTGCGALAAVLHAKGALPGGELTVHNPGGVIRVQVSASGVELEGPTEVVQILQLDL